MTKMMLDLALEKRRRHFWKNSIKWHVGLVNDGR
jgi:hypothetical protein